MVVLFKIYRDISHDELNFRISFDISGSKLKSELLKVPVDVHGHTMEVDRIVNFLTEIATKTWK